MRKRRSLLGPVLAGGYGTYLLVALLVFALPALDSLTYCGLFGGVGQIIVLLPSSLLVIPPLLWFGRPLCDAPTIWWGPLRLLGILLSAALNLALFYWLGVAFEWLLQQLERLRRR